MSSRKIVPSSRLTFGKHRGKAMKDCPTDYLKWMSKNLAESDFFQWAQAADRVLKQREKDTNIERPDLEAEADRILRDAGFKP